MKGNAAAEGNDMQNNLLYNGEESNGSVNWT